MTEQEFINKIDNFCKLDKFCFNNGIDLFELTGRDVKYGDDLCSYYDYIYYDGCEFTEYDNKLFEEDKKIVIAYLLENDFFYDEDKYDEDEED